MTLSTIVEYNIVQEFILKQVYLILDIITKITFNCDTFIFLSYKMVSIVTAFFYIFYMHITVYIKVLSENFSILLKRLISINKYENLTSQI